MKWAYKRPLPSLTRIDARIDTDRHRHAVHTRTSVTGREWTEYRCVCLCGWKGTWWHSHRRFALNDFEAHRDGRELPDVRRMAVR